MVKKKINNEFPSKKEIIATILKEDPQIKKFEKLILIIEHKKINPTLAIIKGELVQNGRVVLKGSMSCIPERSDDSFNWNILKAGQSYFNVFSFDYKGETITSLITQGLKKSLKEGRIPFINKK